MKKVIVASLVFLMMGAAVIYAESTSLVGRKVQSEAVITLNGDEIGAVLIIDGVSYAPVRVIAEASGLTAGYKKGEVMLATNAVKTTSTESINVDSLTKEKRQLEIRATTLHDFITDSNNVINRYNEILKTIDESLIDTYEEMLENAELERAEYKKELVTVESRISEIDELLK